MGRAPLIEGIRLDLERVARWREILEIISAILLIGALVGIVGSAFVALTAEPDLTTGWSRVSELAYLVASFWYVALAAVAVMLVLGLRVLFDWPASTPNRVAGGALVLAEIVTAAIVVACLLGVIAIFADDTEYLDVRGGEQVGAVLLFGGTGIVSAGIGILAAVGLSSLRPPLRSG